MFWLRQTERLTNQQKEDEVKTPEEKAAQKSAKEAKKAAQQQAQPNGQVAYISGIVLGKKYRHDRTGKEGHALTITFFETACEMVTLEWVDKDGKIVSRGFEAEQLIDVETGQLASGRGLKGSAADTSAVLRPQPQY